jgi:hypothetical protein
METIGTSPSRNGKWEMGNGNGKVLLLLPFLETPSQNIQYCSIKMSNIIEFNRNKMHTSYF